ncbi:CLC_0170 family protein [Paenibacillus sp. GCM10027628]|uniref:CLC_0170 family protein n=1 Tax=Paenibacillus sp. GCM10027628 TaxID=3273413 RepID=UPI0036398FB2
MASGTSIGYVQFTIMLLWMTGFIMLRFDLKSYKLSNLIKEAKVTRILGWFNLALGGVLFVGNWIYRTFYS